MESAGKAAYLWTVRVWKVHVKLRQQLVKECAGKESACKLETIYGQDKECAGKESA